MSARTPVTGLGGYGSGPVRYRCSVGAYDRDQLVGRHRGERLDREHVAHQDEAEHLAGDAAASGAPARRCPSARPTGPRTIGRNPSRSSRCPSGSTTPRTSPSSGSRRLRVVPDREEDPQQPLPRAVGAALDRRQRAPPAGRPAARARRGTGRPWCRSSGAPAPRRPRRRRRPRASTCRRTPARRTAPAPRPGSPPGCPAPRGGARAAARRVISRRPAAKKCSRANSSDSRRSVSRSSRSAALAGVDLERRSRRRSRCARGGAGTRRRRSSRGRARGARPWPSRCRR